MIDGVYVADTMATDDNSLIGSIGRVQPMPVIRMHSMMHNRCVMINGTNGGMANLIDLFNAKPNMIIRMHCGCGGD